jgi:hypothetical protein
MKNSTEGKENNQSSGMFKRNAIVLASLIGTAGMAQAACPADTGGQIYNTTGTTCTAAQTTYSGSIASSSSALLLANGANSVINITGADVKVTNYGYVALRVGTGSTINASGILILLHRCQWQQGLALGRDTAVHIEGALARIRTVNGNLDAYSFIY